MEKEKNIIVEKLTGMWQIAESNIGKYMLIKARWTPELQIAKCFHLKNCYYLKTINTFT